VSHLTRIFVVVFFGGDVLMSDVRHLIAELPAQGCGRRGAWGVLLWTCEKAACNGSSNHHWIHPDPAGSNVALNFIFGEFWRHLATNINGVLLAVVGEARVGAGIWRTAVSRISMDSMVDLSTLIAVAVFAKGVSGVLLIYAWFTNRHAPALALWAIAFLVASVGTALFVTEERIGDVRLIDIADALLIGAYGLLWMGARSFNHRRTPVAYLLVAPAAWFLVRQLEIWHFSDASRIAFVSSILLCCLVLTGFEFWRSNRSLPSGWPLIVIIGVQAGIFLSRILWPGWMLRALSGGNPTLSAIALFCFELLFQTFFAAFLLAFLVKERREEHFRRASLVDPLTNIWNRRAFLEFASRRLNRAAIDKQAVALISFDLDHFKYINDRYGHQAGDRMLRSFCDVVSEALRASDLFGRIGGEEFACLLVDVSTMDAVATAERLRCRFADMEISTGSTPLRATVSSGVAITGQPQPELEALMSAADRALYRAKELGRNRVELEKTILQDAQMQACELSSIDSRRNWSK
jgi:diguanylate cyclase (GGDEF)-like protein